MRVIGVLNSEKEAFSFSNLLNQKNIAHQIEIKTNNDWGNPDYGNTQSFIWIIDEDQVEEAQSLLHSEKDLLSLKPTNAEDYPLPASQPPLLTKNKNSKPQPSPKQFSMGIATRIILLGCSLLFFISQLITSTTELPPNIPVPTLFVSPIDKAIIYDYPYVYSLIDRMVKLYGYEALENPKDLPPEGKILMQQINKTPYWQGLYQIVLKEGFKAIPHEMATVPMFEKIKEGQLWRLISPWFSPFRSFGSRTKC